MAEIPVERKGGVPWWAWLLGALLLFGLLFLLFNNRDRDAVAIAPAPAVVADPVAMPAATATAPAADVAATGPITDLATITGTADRQSLVGRQVALSNVRVLDVVGDRSFFIGTDENRRAFVVLNEVPTPGSPVEGRYNVEPGQMVNVSGVMRRPGESAFAGQPIENMPAGTDVLIHAQSLDIVQRP